MSEVTTTYWQDTDMHMSPRDFLEDNLRYSRPQDQDKPYEDRHGFAIYREAHNEFPFISWKLRCSGCDQQWGGWEKLKADQPLAFNGWEYPNKVLRRYLADHDFVTLKSGMYLCPACSGKETVVSLVKSPASLTEGTPPGALDSWWFTGTLERMLTADDE